MAYKAKHAFGALENIDAALANGTIDAHDIVFAKDATGKPYIGWIDKDGNKVICDDSEEFAKLDAKIGDVALDSIAAAKEYTDAQIENVVMGAIEVVEF